MSNYYGNARGAGGGYGMGRGRGGGYPPQMGYPPNPMQMMRGGPGPGYMNRGGGPNYDYDMGMEQSWEEPNIPDPRMVPPPSAGGRGQEISPQGQRILNNNRGGQGQQQQPSSGPGGALVKYANDCEIIVTAKAQQQYAEMIEKAVKDFHLKADLMFPKADVKLSAFIENIASMGTIFAVVIRPDNEAHRSVSVHVLRGCPKAEEHRNMPLSAAYSLIRDRYTEIKRREVGVVPENIRVVLRSLIDEKTLTDKEYSLIIKFLQDRRRKLKAFENRTNNIIGKEDDLLNNPDADELKQRILQILNAKDGEGERIGDLIVPKPTKPLGSLSSDPNSSGQSAMQSDISMIPNFSSGGSSRGMGRGRGAF